MYEVITTKSFRKAYKRVSKSKSFREEEFNYVLELLRNDKEIPKIYRDHALTGEYKGFRDIHIAPDMILIYLKIRNILVLELVNIGSHCEVF